MLTWIARPWPSGVHGAGEKHQRKPSAQAAAVNAGPRGMLAGGT